MTSKIEHLLRRCISLYKKFLGLPLQVVGTCTSRRDMHMPRAAMQHGRRAMQHRALSFIAFLSISWGAVGSSITPLGSRKLLQTSCTGSGAATSYVSSNFTSPPAGFVMVRPLFTHPLFTPDLNAHLYQACCLAAVFRRFASFFQPHHTPIA